MFLQVRHYRVLQLQLLLLLWLCLLSWPTEIFTSMQTTKVARQVLEFRLFKVFCQNRNHHTTAAFRETVRLLEPAAAAAARNKSKETKAAYHRHFFFLPLLPVQREEKAILHERKGY
jgi:hypothetical protein